MENVTVCVSFFLSGIHSNMPLNSRVDKYLYVNVKISPFKFYFIFLLYENIYISDLRK